MEKLRERNYCAVILDPMIGERLNGYAVLNFLELEQPETVERLFLFTGMSEQTIRRTAPSVLPRLFRKSSALPVIYDRCANSPSPITGSISSIASVTSVEVFLPGANA